MAASWVARSSRPRKSSSSANGPFRLLRGRRPDRKGARIAQVGLAEAAVTLQKVGAYRDPRLYALNVFADRFSQSVQPLVPSRLFISSAGNKPGEGQGNGSVLETLLSLILSEKAGINIQENTASSKPLEDFIRQFTASGSSGNGEPIKKRASAEKAATASR